MDTMNHEEFVKHCTVCIQNMRDQSIEYLKSQGLSEQDVNRIYYASVLDLTASMFAPYPEEKFKERLLQGGLIHELQERHSWIHQKFEIHGANRTF